MDNSKIKFVWNSVITEILGKEKVESVRLKDTLNGEVSEMPIDGVFIFIGHNPNNQLYQGQLDMDERGYVLTDMRMHTSVPGVFAAGELADPNFRQVITSAGMGAAAAMEATHFIGEHSGEYSSAEISAEVKP